MRKHSPQRQMVLPDNTHKPGDKFCHIDLVVLQPVLIGDKSDRFGYLVLIRMYYDIKWRLQPNSPAYCLRNSANERQWAKVFLNKR